MVSSKFLTDKNKILAALITLTIVMIVFFWPTMVELHQRWSDSEGNYSYGYLVPLAAAYMLWARVPLAMRNTRDHAWNDSLWMSLLVASMALGSTLVWAMGYMTYTGAIAQLALPVIFIGWMITIVGFDLGRRLLIPLLFCFFAIPVWEVLGEPLRKMAILVTEQLLMQAEIPVLIDGFKIHMAYGVVEIAGGCSGLNFLMAGMVIGSFYAYMYTSGKNCWIALALIVFLSLLSNWVRIFVLILIGHYSHMQHSLMHDHATFGWLIYAVTLVLYFVLLHFLIPRSVSDEGEVQPYNSEESLAWPTKNIFLKVIVIASCLFIALAARVQVKGSSTKGGFVLNDSQWVERPASWLPAYHGYDEVQNWQFDSSSYGITLTTMNYYEQDQGKELVHENNYLAYEGIQTLSQVIDVHGRSLTHSVFSANTSQVHFYTLFRVGDWYTTSPLMAKLYQVFANISGDSRASFYVFKADCLLSCSAENSSEVVDAIDKVLDDLNWTDK